MLQRLFIAAVLTNSQTNELQKLQNDIKSLSTKASLIRPENLHLTLRFLGDCDERQTEQIRELLLHEKSRLIETLPAELLLTGISAVGSFSGRDGELVFARLNVSRSIRQLVSVLEQGVQKLGFPAERKKWFPHVTLARRVVWKDREESAYFVIDKNQPLEPIPALHLFRSEFTDRGMKYTSIFDWIL